MKDSLNLLSLPGKQTPCTVDIKLKIQDKTVW